MVGYLLDTNHLSRLVNTRHPFRTHWQAAVTAGDVFFIILPIITETVAGFSILPRATQNWAEWQELRPAIILLPLDEDDAVEAARLHRYCSPYRASTNDSRCLDCHHCVALRPDTAYN